MLWAEGLMLDPDAPDVDTLEGFWSSLTVVAAVAELCPPSDRRVGLIILGDIKQGIVIGTENSITAATGMPLSTANNIIEFYLWRHGKIVQKPWFAFGAVGAGPTGVIQIMRK